MNLMQVKINANATSDTNDYANGSNVKQPKVAQVGTMNPNAGRRWWSSLLLLGIVFSALAFSAEAKAAPSDIVDQAEGWCFVGTYGYFYGLFTLCEDGSSSFVQILPEGVYGPPFVVEFGPNGERWKLRNSYLASSVSLNGNSIVIQNAKNVELYEAESSKRLSNSMIFQTGTNIYELDFSSLQNSVYVINYIDTNNELIQRLFIKSENQAFLNHNNGGQK